jgi:hypothetical protein
MLRIFLIAILWVPVVISFPPIIENITIADLYLSLLSIVFILLNIKHLHCWWLVFFILYIFTLTSAIFLSYEVEQFLFILKFFVYFIGVYGLIRYSLTATNVTKLFFVISLLTMLNVVDFFFGFGITTYAIEAKYRLGSFTAGSNDLGILGAMLVIMFFTQKNKEMSDYFIGLSGGFLLATSLSVSALLVLLFIAMVILFSLLNIIFRLIVLASINAQKFSPTFISLFFLIAVIFIYYIAFQNEYELAVKLMDRVNYRWDALNEGIGANLRIISIKNVINDFPIFLFFPWMGTVPEGFIDIAPHSILFSMVANFGLLGLLICIIMIIGVIRNPYFLILFVILSLNPLKFTYEYFLVFSYIFYLGVNYLDGWSCNFRASSKRHNISSE